MKIIVDLRPLLSGKISGVEVFTNSIIQALSQVKTPNLELVFWVNASKDFDFGAFKKLGTCVQTRIPNKIFNISASLFRFPKIDRLIQKKLPETDLKQCVLFVPDPRPSPVSRTCKKIFTIHDLSPLYFPEYFNWKTRIFHKLLRLKKELEEAHTIIAVSEFTKECILSKLKIAEKKIKVVYESAEEGFFLETVIPLKPKETLPKKFILSLFTLEPRKNIQRAIEAFFLFHKANPDISLVLVGRKNSKIFSEIKIQENANIVWIQRFISLEEKKWLYQNAECFLYPSLFEGFGLPLLEAMSQNCPVVFGNNSSMREIMGNEGIPVNSLSVHSIAEGLNRAKEVKRENLKSFAEKFSWKKAGQELFEIMSEK